MIRTYSILSTNGELQHSPYIKELEKKYDLVLSTNEPKVINFLFQISIERSEAHQIYAIFDEELLEVDEVYVDCFTNQTLVSTRLTVKEIGSFKISLVVPDRLSMSHSNAERMTSGY